MKKKYTIKDIANLAGVSKGTVDRVLHNRGKVSAKAFDSINKVLAEIDYQPNLMARSLKQNRTYVICIVIPDPKLDPYWLPCLDGIENAKKEFSAFNVSVEIYYFNPKETSSFLEVNETVIRKNPDAVLFVPLFFKETLLIVKEYQEARVLTGTFNNEVHSDLIDSFIGQDLIQSGRVAARLMHALIKEGTIAIIHVDEVLKNAVHMQEKEKGFKAFFKELNNANYKIVTGKIRQPNLEADFLRFLKKHNTISGIFVTTSKAYMVAEILNRLKISQPALVGYDLLEKNLNFLNSGTIDFLINQNQKRQAYLGTTNFIEHFILSKDITRRELLPIDIVNTENVNCYVR